MTTREDRRFGAAQVHGDTLAEARHEPGDIVYTAQAASVIAARKGYLPCDGTLVRKETYRALHAAIGDVWSFGGPFANEFRTPVITPSPAGVVALIKT